MHSIEDCELRTKNYTAMYTAMYTAIDNLNSTDYLHLFFTSVKLPFFVFTKPPPAILLPTLLLPQNDPSSFIFPSRKELASRMRAGYESWGGAFWVNLDLYEAFLGQIVCLNTLFYLRAGYVLPPRCAPDSLKTYLFPLLRTFCSNVTFIARLLSCICQ